MGRGGARFSPVPLATLHPFSVHALPPPPPASVSSTPTTTRHHHHYRQRRSSTYVFYSRFGLCPFLVFAPSLGDARMVLLPKHPLWRPEQPPLQPQVPPAGLYILYTYIYISLAVRRKRLSSLLPLSPHSSDAAAAASGDAGAAAGARGQAAAAQGDPPHETHPAQAQSQPNPTNPNEI